MKLRSSRQMLKMTDNYGNTTTTTKTTTTTMQNLSVRKQKKEKQIKWWFFHLKDATVVDWADSKVNFIVIAGYRAVIGGLSRGLLSIDRVMKMRPKWGNKEKGKRFDVWRPCAWEVGSGFESLRPSANSRSPESDLGSRLKVTVMRRVVYAA